MSTKEETIDEEERWTDLEEEGAREGGIPEVAVARITQESGRRQIIHKNFEHAECRLKTLSVALDLRRTPGSNHVPWLDMPAQVPGFGDALSGMR